MPETTAQRTVRRATVALLGASMLLGALGVAMAKAEPLNEDDPSFSCVLDGNHVCGPENAMGAVPGYYVDGQLVSPWPVIVTCVVPPGRVLDECDAAYVDPAFVHLGTGAQPGPA